MRANLKRPIKSLTRRKTKIIPYGVESWLDCGVSYGQVSGENTPAVYSNEKLAMIVHLRGIGDDTGREMIELGNAKLRSLGKMRSVVIFGLANHCLFG